MHVHARVAHAPVIVFTAPSFMKGPLGRKEESEKERQ